MPTGKRGVLVSGSILLVVLMVSTGVFSYVEMKRITDQARNRSQVDMLATTELERLNNSLHMLLQWHVVHTGAQTLKDEFTSDRKVKAAEDAVRASMEQLEALPDVSKRREFTVLRHNVARLLDTNRKMLSVSGESIEATKVRSLDFRSLHDLVDSNITALKESLLEEASEASGRQYQSLIMYTLLGMVVILLFGAFLGQSIIMRLRVANALEISEATLRTVFNSTSDGIIIHDLDGAIIDGNETACARLGYTHQELLALRVADLDAPASAALVPQRIQAIKDTGRGLFESDHRRKDGSTLPVEISARLIEFRGRPAVLSVVRDVTERRELAERLKHAEKMEAIGQLAGGIAHDFNNQLAGIMGYAEMARAELPPRSAGIEYVEGVLGATRHAADLTAQLLAFARKGKVRTITVDLHQLIHEVVGLLQHSIDKRIAIRAELQACPATTVGDPTQLQNALLNVALNARDAMPQGGTLTFRTTCLRVDEHHSRQDGQDPVVGAYVAVAVQDTGTGMDAQTRRHLFEPFFTTKPQGKGTGLGLAAVWGTVKSHKGFIEVNTEEGRGTTFTLAFPQIAAQTSRVEASPVPQPEAPVKEHILLVDDEESLRTVVTWMLGKLGYQVTACSHGSEAVEVYRKAPNRYALVILDMVMPTMNGPQTFRALKAINPAVKVVLASGFSLDGEAQALLKEGASGFLQKPFGREQLAASVAEVLGRSAGPTELVPSGPGLTA